MTSGTIRLVGGRYELGRVVGSGGSGSVHLARDRVLHRDVALKLLRPGYDDVARQRLRTEARIAASLGHPGIARVLDFGEETRGGESVPYLVMEYVEGPTLRDALHDGTHLTPARVLRLLAEVGDALAAAHAAGVVHRDVKPGNIVLTPQGRAILLDFGIARHAEHEPLTVTGTIVGTLDYLSPEQAAGASATPRSDIFALGMVAYEALTGLRPLSRDTQVATLLAHARETVPPLPATVPPGLRALVMSMVARDPARRPADAGTVAARARELLRPTPVSAPDIVTLPAPWWRRPWTVSAAAVAMVALAGVLVIAGHPGDATAPVGAAAPSVTARASGSHAHSRSIAHATPKPSPAAAVVSRPQPHRVTPHRVTPHPAGPRPPAPTRHGHGHGPDRGPDRGPGHGAAHGPAHGPGHGHGR